MHLYQLHYEQFLPISLEQAWEFFSTPHNLNRITPPELHFQVLSGADEPAHTGQIIQYKIRVAPLTRVSWVTEITHVTPQHSFVDEQRFGPFRFWHHLHRFHAVEGGVIATDHVHYALPFGILGRIVNALWVKRQNQSIFQYRQKILNSLFPKP